MNLPEDPNILLSFINMKMRDNNFETLGELCDSLGCDEKDLIKKLEEAGYEYVSSQKQFK